MPGISGYGLYSDNVYLKGTLVTQSGNGYTGINTTSGYTATVFGTEDKGRIVIWAGEPGTSEDNVTNAPF
jgi:hypothetical protein